MGRPKFAECALGLGRSLKLVGDSTKRVLLTDIKDPRFQSCFDEVIPCDDPLPWVFFSKLTFLDRTDADAVLFIDSDSLAFKKLDPIFERCAGTKFAVCGRRRTSGAWWGKDIAEHCRSLGIEAMPQFNGGFIYYERTPETQAFIQQVRQTMEQAKEIGFWQGGGIVPDEPCISLLLERTGFGTLLPDTIDFQNSATGLIGKLHMDVRTGACEFLTRNYEVRMVKPYIFHASRYMNFLVYWKQLDALERLENYQNSHPYGYMSPFQKFQRSFEKRLLKYVYRKL
jgi:hypothetical protein